MKSPRVTATMNFEIFDCDDERCTAEIGLRDIIERKEKIKASWHSGLTYRVIWLFFYI